MQTPEEELLNIYFQPAQKGDAGAIFLSAAEILRTLIDAGRITRPMPIHTFGVLLQQQGFNKTATTGGKKGYLVIEYREQEVQDQHKADAKELQGTMPELHNDENPSSDQTLPF